MELNKLNLESEIIDSISGWNQQSQQKHEFDNSFVNLKLSKQTMQHISPIQNNEQVNRFLDKIKQSRIYTPNRNNRIHHISIEISPNLNQTHTFNQENNYFKSHKPFTPKHQIHSTLPINPQKTEISMFTVKQIILQQNPHQKNHNRKLKITQSSEEYRKKSTNWLNVCQQRQCQNDTWVEIKKMQCSNLLQELNQHGISRKIKEKQIKLKI